MRRRHRVLVDKLCGDPSEDHCAGSDGHSTHIPLLDAAGTTVEPCGSAFAEHRSGIPPVALLRPRLAAGQLEGATGSAHFRRGIATCRSCRAWSYSRQPRERATAPRVRRRSAYTQLGQSNSHASVSLNQAMPTWPPRRPRHCPPRDRRDCRRQPPVDPFRAEAFG